MRTSSLFSAHRTTAVLAVAVVVFGSALLAFQQLRDALIFILLAVLAVATVAFALTARRSAAVQLTTEEIEPVHLPDTGKLPVLDEEVEEARRTVVAQWPVYMH